MKKIILTIVLLTNYISYSQEIEKMNKKELRTAFEVLNTTKQKVIDSLSSIIVRDNIALEYKNDTIKKQKLTLITLKHLLDENETKVKSLERTIKLQKDEIVKLSQKPLEIDIFTKVPEEFNTSNYLVFSENEELFKKKNFKIVENLNNKTILLFIDSKPVYLNFKEEKSTSEKTLPDQYFTNERFTMKFSKIVPIALDEETLVYEAEFTLIDDHGNILNFKVLGLNNEDYNFGN